jgi:hypothetical protein
LSRATCSVTGASGGGGLVHQRPQDRPADALAAPLGDHGDVDQVQGVDRRDRWPAARPARRIDRDDLEPGARIGRAIALDLGVELLLHDLGQHVGGQGKLVPAGAAGSLEQRQAERRVGLRLRDAGRSEPSRSPLRLQAVMREALPVQVARSS